MLLWSCVFVVCVSVGHRLLMYHRGIRRCSFSLRATSIESTVLSGAGKLIRTALLLFQCRGDMHDACKGPYIHTLAYIVFLSVLICLSIQAILFLSVLMSFNPGNFLHIRPSSTYFLRILNFLFFNCRKAVSYNCNTCPRFSLERTLINL